MRKKFWIIMFALGLVGLSCGFSGCDSGPHQLTISVSPNGGGSVLPGPNMYSGEITLIATPNKYFDFIGWAGSASGNNNQLKIRMNSDKHIVAEFKKKIGKLDVRINPPTSGTVQPDKGAFEQGTQVKMAAAPATGYRFGNWDGDMNGITNPANVFIDRENINVTANFVKQYFLKLTSDPAYAGSVIPEGGPYDSGMTLTLNAEPNFPYYPKTWIGTDTDTNPAAIRMNSDKLVTIVFGKNVKGETKTEVGAVSKDALGRWGPVVSKSIQLNQFEWVEGEIIWQTPNTPNTPIGTNIQDQAGKIIKNFGSSKQANFQFMAQTAGRYTITFQNESIWYADFHLNYTKWVKP
jgi:hypothetical protein